VGINSGGGVEIWGALKIYGRCYATDGRKEPSDEGLKKNLFSIARFQRRRHSKEKNNALLG
jgi:hypothetical protein